MKIFLNKIHFPVTTLGPGRRIGIWFQGCSIGCQGCISKDTWQADSSAHLTEVQSVFEVCEKLTARNFDGITISGGEPFDQPDALRCLLRKLHAWRLSQNQSFDVVCYSGYRLDLLGDKYSDILDLIDVTISGPYVESLAPGNKLKGSANQHIKYSSNDVQDKFESYLSANTGVKNRIQLEVDDKSVWCIGIPNPGDMEKLQRNLARRGIKLGGVSWRG